MRADSTSRWASRQRASRHVLVAVAVILGCWLSARHAQADTFTGKVVGVADGDTITVLRDKTPVKIRLQGVDAPEKAQPFGEKAKQLTSSLVFGKEVRVEVVSKDKYGRTLAKVSYLGQLHRNPLDRTQPHQVVTVYHSLEESLLRAGLAWWFRKYSKDKKLGQIEEDARKAKRGLWADLKPTPPWIWRHPDLVCKKDADCVFLPPVCPRCPPCKPTPRRVGNITTLKQIQKTQTRMRCAKPKCRPCASAKNWVEGKIVCEDGRCELKAGAASAAPAAALPPAPAGSGGIYHGNSKSKVLHAPGLPRLRLQELHGRLQDGRGREEGGVPAPWSMCNAVREVLHRVPQAEHGTGGGVGGDRGRVPTSLRTTMSPGWLIAICIAGVILAPVAAILISAGLGYLVRYERCPSCNEKRLRTHAVVVLIEDEAQGAYSDDILTRTPSTSTVAEIGFRSIPRMVLRANSIRRGKSFSLGTE